MNPRNGAKKPISEGRCQPPFITKKITTSLGPKSEATFQRPARHDESTQIEIVRR